MVSNPSKLNTLADKLRSDFYEGKTANDWKGTFPCVAEYKEDGEYSIMFGSGNITILANQGCSEYQPTPEILEGLPPKGQSFVIEGEHRTSRGGFNQFLSDRNNPLAAKYKLFVAYGIIHYRGVDTSDLPYKERWNLLEQVIKNNNNIYLVKHKICNNTNDIQQFFEQAVADGFEGIVVKSLGSRNQKVMKLKQSITSDFAVSGIEKSKSWIENKIPEVFILSEKDQEGNWKVIGKVSSGLTKDAKFKLGQELLKLQTSEDTTTIHCKPYFMLEIKFMNYESNGLRQPRIMRIRYDKIADKKSNIGVSLSSWLGN